MRSLLALAAAASVGVLAAPAGLAGQAAQAGQAVPTPIELAARIQAHYAGVRDFQSDFTQVTTGGFIRQESAAAGRVLVLKPGRMRWKYTSKTKQEVVSDGKFLYTYVPVDRLGSQTPLPAGDSASLGLLFLTGRGDLVRDFTPSAGPSGHPPGEWHVKVTPKNRQSDFTSLTLMVDRASLKLTGLTRTDTGGETTFRFPNLRENVGLTDKDFHFVFPPGTHIDK